MLRILFMLSAGLLFTCGLLAQPVTGYKVSTHMVPMRDGVKLYTMVFAPENVAATFPVLLQRTPYGAEMPPEFSPLKMASLAAMAKEGYIFVYQDIRGKYKSGGNMEIHQPIIHLQQPGAIDESTDTWDTVDWLIKNVPRNNGKAGIWGGSYPGWLALVGGINPHPALKASSEQACMGDLFLGDDFHHNGAFRLSYGFEYTYEVEYDKTTDSDFPFPQFDLYDWYLQLGSLKNVNAKYFHGKIPTWNRFVQHPHYDSFWQRNSPLSYMQAPAIPQLHVGGYFDQEDVNGPQLMYGHLERKDSFNRNHIVLGPWYHGQWGQGNASNLGRVQFGSNTAAWFQQLHKQWFDYWLKGIGDGQFKEAYCFETGSNQWKTYNSWPPKEAVVKKLYAHANNTCSFTKPAAKGWVRYTSDPAKPVPYRLPPIEATYGTGSRWRIWHVEDQRFVYNRPDVVSFTGDTLTADLTVAGTIKAHVFAATTGTDADWIVKLIDVYPNKDTGSMLLMSQYQLPVAMEVFRGRYRKSFSHPTPLTPNKPEEFIIDLHQINHVFKKGHRLMIQVQSTWFPVIDRNPQKYVHNIFEAKESDFIKAEHTIYCTPAMSTYIELPVLQ